MAFLSNPISMSYLKPFENEDEFNQYGDQDLEKRPGVEKEAIEHLLRLNNLVLFGQSIITIFNTQLGLKKTEVINQQLNSESNIMLLKMYTYLKGIYYNF